MPLGPFNNPFGHGASPILAGEMLLMVCDQDTNSFLLAIDKLTGRVIWRTERPHAQRGYATRILYQPHGIQVLVAGTHRLSGYDARTGKELWWIRRLPWQIKPTPVLDGDTVYFVTFSAETEPGEQEILPPFVEALAKLDVTTTAASPRKNWKTRAPRPASMSTSISTTPATSKSATGTICASAGWVRAACAPTGWAARAT